MEQFEKFHQSVTIDNVEVPATETQAKTATLFVPAAFELSRNVPKVNSS